MNLPGNTRPSRPGSCSHAILARLAPSGQGEMLPELTALTAISLPRTKRKVLLSPRSVVLIAFQFSKAGSNGNPSSSGRTVDRDAGAGTALPGPVRDWFGAGVHGARN